jgi:hypothetical protein
MTLIKEAQAARVRAHVRAMLSRLIPLEYPQMEASPVS